MGVLEFEVEIRPLCWGDGERIADREVLVAKPCGRVAWWVFTKAKVLVRADCSSECVYGQEEVYCKRRCIYAEMALKKAWARLLDEGIVCRVDWRFT